MSIMIDPDPVTILEIVEGRLGISVWAHVAEEVFSKRRSQDVMVNEIYDLVLSAALHCKKCSYDLQGHVSVAIGECPECGVSFDMVKHGPDAVWRVLCEVIGSIVGRPVAQIEKHQFLYADLNLGKRRK